MDGLILVDKPQGWTSHDVVGKMRRLAQTKRIGHLGTLDPMATGVLPLVLNRATRLSQFYLKLDKTYEAEVRFGFSTNTYDAEGEATSPAQEISLRAEELEPYLEAFRGRFAQMPPPVSAKKINGTPAYKLARQNKPVELQPVEVTVSELTLLRCAADRAWLRIACAGGTYVRSIAHDLGTKLGVGAHLTALRRTRVGEFAIERCRTVAELESLAAEGRLGEALLPASQLMPWMPSEVVTPEVEQLIRQGRDFRVNPFRTREGHLLKALNQQGELVAIGEMRFDNLYHPSLVLANS